MSKKKKVVITALAASLAASSALTGMPAANAAIKTAAVAQAPVEKPQISIPQHLENPESPKEVIRIIVELEAAPAILAATQQGLSYKDFSASAKAVAEKTIEQQQAEVQSSMKKAIGAFEVEQAFTTVFNGFSLEVKAQDVKKLALVPGVKAVYESQEYTRPEVKPEMVTSKELVQAQLAWDKYDFKGEGTVVAVIDSGIDPAHRDYVLTDESQAELTEDEVNQALTSGEIEAGKFYTAKVPFGYNYMDDNYEVRDIGPGASMHGQHVSGTVGANGDEENGGIKGVAPEAQILAMKVFGNDKNFGSTFGDVYIKAIDDAIKLGADVINMSLGSVAGYVDNANPEQMAVARAKDNGLIVSISAGNSDQFGSGWWYPSANNQDYGVTGSPSVSEASLGVASFENTELIADAFTFSADGEKAGDALFLLANDVKAPEGQDIEVLAAGLGKPEDFADQDFTGKFALVSRGGNTFVEKGLNAQAAGAAGVIVYNNASGTINMASDDAIKIPYMSALQSDGLAMKALIDGGKTVEVRFDGTTVSTANPEAGKMSSFTSWGPTPNLDFKPEITAPGGNIYSTFNNDEYGLMSGTSMAAPHVAGGSALIFERVDNEFNLSGYARAQMAKNLLMNTSKPVELNPGEFVSPRRQGAGIMQLANALETDVIVYDKATGEGKVALKEIEGGQFSLDLEARNFSDTDKTYNVTVQLQSDNPIDIGTDTIVITNDALYGSYVFASTGDEIDYTVEIPATVTVPANGITDVSIAIDASESEWLLDYFTNGYFIDGFVTLTDATPEEGETENLVPLTVPFFGFNGSWDDAPIFDEEFWKGDASFYGQQGLYDVTGKPLLGKAFASPDKVDPTTFAFSPNGDGSFDTALPVFSLERNAKKLEVNVLDKNGKKLRTIATNENLLKHYSSQNPRTFNAMYAWDGMINGKPAAEGDYQIELRAVIDFEGAEWQSVKYGVKIDREAPTLTVAIDNEEQQAIVEAADNLSGVNYVEVYAGEIEKDEKPLKVLIATDDEVPAFDVSSYNPGAKLTFKAVDVAGNSVTTAATVGATEETNAPVIDWLTPRFFDVFSSSTVEFTGKVTDESDITEVTVDGEAVSSFDGTNFKHTKELADGLYKVKIAAKDEFGNASDIQRQIFVDSTPATLEFANLPKTVSLSSEDPTIEFTVRDNFDFARVYVNGSEIFFKDLSEPYGMKALEQKLTYDLELEEGANEFEVKVVDLAGHETVEMFTVYKTDEPVVTGDVIEAGDIENQLNDPQAEFVIIPAEELADGETARVELGLSAVSAAVEAGKPLVIQYGDATLELPLALLQAWEATGADSFIVKITKNGEFGTTATKLSDSYTVEVNVANGDTVVPLTKLQDDLFVSVPLTGTVKDERKVAAYHETAKGSTYSGGFVLDGSVHFAINKTGKYTVYEKNVTFADIKTHWAKDQIEVLASRSITNGKSATQFVPQAKVTRAEFAVLIARALNLPMSDYQGTFKDVTLKNDWAYAGIEAAYNAGIVNGRTTTQFAPNENITRQEMAVMVMRAVEYQDAALLDGVDGSHKFKDDKKIASWARESVQLAYELEIINGRPGNEFDPTANATRAESAKILYTSLEALGEF